MSNNPIIGAIFENMEGIKITFEPTFEAFKKDRKNTGDSKEYTVSNFIKCFFPTSYSVKKGSIYNMETSSNEIDCIILAPNHPKLITPKREIIIAEGVYAAIEVKPDIASLTIKSEFHRALRQIQSVKKLNREIEFPRILSRKIPDEFKSIPCAIFAKKSCAVLDTIDYMKECVLKGLIKPNELPDIIITLDHGIIYHSLIIEKTLFHNWAAGKTGEKYVHIDSEDEITLGIFLLILLCFISPEPLMSDHIIKRYIKQGLNDVNCKYYIIES